MKNDRKWWCIEPTCRNPFTMEWMEWIWGWCIVDCRGEDKVSLRGVVGKFWMDGWIREGDTGVFFSRSKKGWACVGGLKDESRWVFCYFIQIESECGCAITTTTTTTTTWSSGMNSWRTFFNVSAEALGIKKAYNCFCNKSIKCNLKTRTQKVRVTARHRRTFVGYTHTHLKRSVT